MRVAVVFALVAVAAVAHGIVETEFVASALSNKRWASLTVAEQAKYGFEDFIAEFGKTYNNREAGLRRKLFERRHAQVMAHNMARSSSYTMAINHLADHTEEEFGMLLGYNKNMAHSFKESAIVQEEDVTKHVPVSALPASVDWRTKNVVSKVKNQGGCGSCWAFATTEEVESYVAIATGKLLDLAPQQLVSCSPDPKHCGGTGGCEGSVPEVAFQYIEQAGFTTESQYPYQGRDSTCRYKTSEGVATIKGYVKVDSNNYTAVMNALATQGPLAIAVQANTWMAYGGGVFRHTECTMDNTDIDHAVQLVGYGTDNGKDYWIVRNSWGPSWGEDGYIRLERNPTSTPCSPDKRPADGTGCSGGPKTVTVCGTCGILYDTCYPTGAGLKPNQL